MSETYTDASCRQMPIEAVDEYFFEGALNNSRAKVAMAKRICENCVVLPACREAALDEMPPFGVMAGLTPADRVRIKYSGDAA